MYFLMMRMLTVQSVLSDLFYTPIWFYLCFCSVLGYALRCDPYQIRILIGKVFIELRLLSTLYLFSHLHLVTIMNIFYFRHANTNMTLVSINEKIFFSNIVTSNPFTNCWFLLAVTHLINSVSAIFSPGVWN